MVGRKRAQRWVYFVLGGLLCICVQAMAQSQQGLELPVIDQQKILEEAGITRSGDFYKSTGCDDLLTVEMIVVDLNGDNQPEVILRVTGSPCFSGVMQSNVGVYVRSSQGVWRDALGFLPAFGIRVQEAKTKGFADIVLTVMGGCDPLYRWTGGSYYYAELIPAYEGAKCQR